METACQISLLASIQMSPLMLFALYAKQLDRTVQIDFEQETKAFYARCGFRVGPGGIYEV
ncbi:MAG: hypothetical protein NVS4B12_03090 [Ktedonobacteraceae bacterium]